MPSLTFTMADLVATPFARRFQAEVLRNAGAPVVWDPLKMDASGDIIQGAIRVNGNMQRIVDDIARTVEYRW